MALLVRALFAAILLLILLFALYSKKGMFTLGRRIIIGVLILFFIGIIAFYEINDTKRSGLNRELLNAFNQNKTLVCKEREVTSADFSYVGGTKVFTQKDKGQTIVPIEGCEVK
jgi:hypothetical protein